ncbi:Ig-like domain-containing protein [Nocardioides sp. Root151]|uniref:Ig-like domain-containing protein n=1 Tax=Nocardioides sp. Root151 TaxID=1736475 RepID=UPI000702A68F|nr:Ig-like domain-containing protein [Nocardioides sp. Root151]KQZ67280.1 hypothetical protein ASD66_20155 [Nocardioides sp. Root151]
MAAASLTGVSSASAAVGRPTNLAPDGAISSSTPTLSWSRPSGAVKFEVEVDNDSDFGSPGFTTTTTNTRAVPTVLLSTGEQNWRVRALNSAGFASGWAVSSFDIAQIAAPTPISPVDNAPLKQPVDPPLLSWTGTQGATSYVVEVDTEDDFVGAKSYTTSTTSLVVPDPLEAGTRFWRVQAVKGSGVVSQPSPAVSFTVQSIKSVTITGPANSADEEVTDVVLDWEPVDGAQYYQLQVATDDAFQTIVDNKENAKVYGTKYSPAITYDNNQYYWRVRAVDLAGQPTAWTETENNFNRVWKNRPEAVFPAGDGLQHVSGAPYFQWTPVTHATQYQLDVGTDANFSPNTFETCQTAGTTYTPGNFVVTGSSASVRPDEDCVMDPGTIMYWRVRPLDRPFTKPGVPGVQGIYSATQSFVYDAAYFSGVSPANGATVDVPTFRWNAVKGAAKYDLTIKNSSGSNVKTATTYSTSYTPTAVPRLTAAAGPYTWTLRALDSTGVASVIEQRSFNVSGDIPTTGVAPLTALAGRLSDPATTRAPALTWEPHPEADHYKLSVGVAGSGTFYTEDAWSDDVLGLKLPYPAVTDTSSHFFLPGGYDWKVTAYTAGGAIIEVGPTNTFRIADFAPVQGQRLALDGQALDAGTTCGAALCDGVPATPVLSWDPQPDIAFYILYISEDANFTNLVETTIPGTTNTRYAFTMSNNRAALPESQAGSAYYWHIRPCKALNVCGPDPVSSIGTGSKSFRKQSPPVKLTGPASDSDPTGENVSSNEVTFEWEDYFVTNQATTWWATSEKSPQAGMQYRIQVATSPTFSGATLIDDQKVDQTTYTAVTKLYPEGTLYWRVQAIDAESNGLAWSAPRSLVKESPRVLLEAPANGQTVSGTAAFQWASQAFTGSYRVEVYKNNDTTFSTANRVFYKDVKTSAYAWDQPLPPSSVAYRWRVRRTDSSGNPGQWSSAGSFLSKGAVPTLTAPASGVWVSPNASLFSWGEVPGATTYKLEIRNDASSRNWKTITTAANAWAATEPVPDGSYKWRVTGIDAKRNAVGSSAWRAFRVDGTRPTVTSATPTSTARAGTNVGVRFSERVAGVTTSTFKLTLRGSTTRIRAVLRLNSTRTAATLNPSANLRRGKYYRVTVSSGIKDVKGNVLVGKTWTFKVS